MDYSKILRENLKDTMRQKGISQAWIAAQADIPEATISRYVTGVHSPKIEYIAKIAAAMNVSVDYLLGLSMSSIPDKPPKPEIRALLAGYERADAHTKKMVWMQLDLFLSDEEKGLAPQQSPEQLPERKSGTA